MNLSLSSLLAPDTASLEHLAALADGLGAAVHQVAQLMGSSTAAAEEVSTRLSEIDSESSVRHMALLTSLRSSFITPLPRQDLYLMADGLNNAVEKVCNAGLLIVSTEQYRLPAEAMDILETLGRQAELLKEATAQFRALDALEETWIQLQRNSKRAERVMVEWVSGMTGDLLQRNYNRQREAAHAVDAAIVAVRQITVHVGSVLVQES
ncbi:hypothetical protein GCM10010977_10860 [Citricoccus zhacaiensis]|uniref:Nuclease PIN n=1 Tax=Citricoccus zhacaiensis TaxID=489142 RepID=A0ABQ2LTZ9_9MICC|nr:hypothetical protein [Citricoccus zhacaiensis]GGO43201.1 hypothetical protein GCM10010977_10860 [Citricoccus zhacaiensis]